MTHFGRPFEHYIQEITRAAVAESKGAALFHNEFLYKYKGNSKASTDCYFRIGNTLIAVEAKAMSPHSRTLTGVAREAIDNEVNELMVSPVTQVLTRLKEIYSDGNDIIGELIKVFPEKKKALVAHYKDYDKLLGHVFFAEAINIPLVTLLRDNKDSETIDKYCKFVEKMWGCGTEEVINIVDVTILERLSDENKVWINFGNYISDEFKTYINEIVLSENIMMFSVPKL